LYFFLFYFALIIGFTFLQKKEIFKGVFKVSGQKSWVVSGLSLFMYYVSVDQGQLITGVIHQKGLSGLWIFWASFLGAAFVPIVLAPLWSKLNFITDNQFILFRFSGKSAKILHQFRSVYVGGIVVAFLISFHTLAFSRIIQLYFKIDLDTSILITGIILLIFTLKNSLNLKFTLDVYHSVIYIISLAISFYFLYKLAHGWDHSIHILAKKNPETLSIFPKSTDYSNWNSIYLYLGVLWWSTQLFDGGGPEMARYTAVKGKWNAIKTGLLPVILNLFLSVILVGMAILSVSIHPNQKEEISFVQNIFESVPNWLDPVCLIGFFAMYITTVESMLNWGGSFLTIDFYKTYLKPNQSKKHYAILSFLAMTFICVLAIIITRNMSSLESVIKVVFSISAGVAPVYILRWFWLRINAWSQLSAMIASGIYTLAFNWYVSLHPIQTPNFNEYNWQIVTVTLLTTITWIIVTFLTPKDDENTIARFKAILPSTKEILRKSGIAFLFGGLLLVLLIVVIQVII
jgi:Na+/proline symporter